jgi:hypothetical protein
VMTGQAIHIGGEDWRMLALYDPACPRQRHDRRASGVHAQARPDAASKTSRVPPKSIRSVAHHIPRRVRRDPSQKLGSLGSQWPDGLAGCTARAAWMFARSG